MTHSSSNTAIRMNNRLDRIEMELSALTTRVAVVEELSKTRQEHTDKQILEIKASLVEISRNTTWLVRLIVGSIISAFLVWIFNGGLAGAS